MCYEIKTTEKFENDVEFYARKKKFKHIINDIEKITNEIKNGNLVGDVIPDLKLSIDNHTYKVRAANTDAHVGKSNGYRIIYYAIKDDKVVYLITIYFKKDDKNIPSNHDIAELIKEYCL